MADSDSTACSPSPQIAETLSIGEQAAHDYAPFLFHLFPCLRRSARSRTRVLADGREVLRGAAYERRRRQVLERDEFRCVAWGPITLSRFTIATSAAWGVTTDSPA
jgi:hypothetical protein